jgi:uncharacterized delta-60 repeat protein
MRSMERLESRQLLTAGALDPSFGTGGIATAVFQGGAESRAEAVVVGRDGREVVAGNSNVGGGLPIVSLARYLPDGKLDPTFGAAGRAASSYGFVSAMAIGPDGTIVTGGGDSYLLVERFLPNGAMDETFNPLGRDGPGIARIPIVADSSDTQVTAVAVRPDGRILLAIRYARSVPNLPLAYQGALVQLQADGGRDDSFGEAGVLMIGTSGGDGEVKISSLLLQDGGRVIAAGSKQGDFVVMRVMRDGTVDSTFGNDAASPGSTRVDLGTASDAATALVKTRDGRIVAVGNAGKGVAVVRLSSNGMPDATFGRGGRVVIPAGLHTVFHAVSAQLGARRRIVITATLQHTGTRLSPATSEVSSIRLLPAGQVDATYGARGRTRTSSLSLESRLVASAPTPDGGTILALTTPYFSDFFVAAKLNADGNIDPAFGDDPAEPGTVRTHFTGAAGLIVYDAIALRSGKIMTIAARTAQDGRGGFLVARWNADGTLDTSFGSDRSGTALLGGTVPRNARLYERRHGNVLAVFNNFVGPGLATIARDGTIVPQQSKDRVLIDGFELTNSTLDSAGNILIVGADKLVRLTAGGALDTPFGVGGIVRLPFDPISVASLSDGRVVVAGVLAGRADSDPAGRVAVAQYLSDGRPDPAFGGRGVMSVAPGEEGNQDRHPLLAVQANGRVILALSRSVPNSQEGERSGLLFGITSDGQLDPEFGVAGQSVPIANGFGIERILVDPEQRLLALGLNDVDPAPDFSVTSNSVTRLSPDGQVDRTFGAGDGAATIFNSGDTPAAISLQADGAIVIAAHNYRGKTLLARLSGDDIVARIDAEILQITTNSEASVQIRAKVAGQTMTIDGVSQTFDIRTFSRVVVRGGDGDDLIDLSQLNLPAEIDGGNGNDSIFGGPSNDLISGNAGRDTLFGGRGNDTLHGNDGNDYLNPGPGQDQAFGDAGNDQIFSLDNATDTLDGGGGFDRAKRDSVDILSNTEGVLA